jgi:hypothetical protein
MLFGLLRKLKEKQFFFLKKLCICRPPKFSTWTTPSRDPIVDRSHRLLRSVQEPHRGEGAVSHAIARPWHPWTCIWTLHGRCRIRPWRDAAFHQYLIQRHRTMAETLRVSWRNSVTHVIDRLPWREGGVSRFGMCHRRVWGLERSSLGLRTPALNGARPVTLRKSPRHGITPGYRAVIAS